MADNRIGSVIIDLESKELTPEEREMIAHPAVGGVIFFTRNYDSPEQLTSLTESIRAASKKPRLIMADQEGGRVQRFRQGFTKLPAMGLFGHLYEQNPKNAFSHAKECGWLMAAELLSAGIDFSLAPVLDLNSGVSEVIGDRAFHADPQIVIKLAQAFIEGMSEAGMAATGKHFPGHGSVTLDSHVAIPVDNRNLAEVTARDLVPFSKWQNLNLKAIMAAHIIFPAIDTVPVGFSRRWLIDILRNQLAFSGVILSDDLNMEGANISIHYTDRVTAAHEAGCDFALLCNNRKGVVEVLDNLTYQKYQVSEEKWGAMQGQFSLAKTPLTQHARWQKANELICSVQKQCLTN